MKIIFFAEAPSKRTKNNASLRNLYKWLDHLDLKYVSFANVSEGDILVDAYCKTCEYDKIVALGNISSYTLEALEIPHFKLPHPSPRNRKLNNKDYVQQVLDQCKVYLRGT